MRSTEPVSSCGPYPGSVCSFGLSRKVYFVNSNIATISTESLRTDTNLSLAAKTVELDCCWPVFVQTFPQRPPPEGRYLHHTYNKKSSARRHCHRNLVQKTRHFRVPLYHRLSPRNPRKFRSKRRCSIHPHRLQDRCPFRTKG